MITINELPRKWWLEEFGGNHNYGKINNLRLMYLYSIPETKLVCSKIIPTRLIFLENNKNFLWVFSAMGDMEGNIHYFCYLFFFSLTWCSLTITMCKNRWMLLFKSTEYVMRTQIIIIIYHFNIFFQKHVQINFHYINFFLRSHTIPLEPRSPIEFYFRYLSCKNIT